MSCWIQTYNNEAVDFDDLRPESIRFHDIAHALSGEPRFSAQTDQVYSVAQHSVLIARELPPELKWQGLMHDAAEAYLKDLSAPVKKWMRKHDGGVSAYDVLERKVWTVIATKFGLPLELDPRVKDADLRMLATEKKCLFNEEEPRPWNLTHRPYGGLTIVPWERHYAKNAFLALAHLGRGREDL